MLIKTASLHSPSRLQVCLSLLGTWHGGAASEKWNPDSSGIFQILLSVQVSETAVLLD